MVKTVLDQIRAIDVPKISKARTNFASFTIGEAWRVLQVVDVDQRAHYDGTPEK